MTQVEFCKFLGKRKKGGLITITPLGRAKNKVRKPTLTGWKNLPTDIVINKKYQKGLDGIEDYSHVIVVYWLDKEAECHLRHHPQGRDDVPFVGIFACRCQQRPIPIGISTVKLISRKGNTVKVSGLDILNNTPILDIKPYTPVYDAAKNPKVPKWVGNLVF